MLWEYEFPFCHVPRNSRVAIYGAGNVGQEYVKQILESDWCSLAYIVDSNYQKHSDASHKVFPVEHLAEDCEYDVVVIAVESSSATREMEKRLNDLKIGPDRVIRAAKHILDSKEAVYFPIYFSSDPEQNEPVTIAFRSSGGFGDNIYSLKVYEQLIKLCPHCKIDVFCNTRLGRPIFGSQPNIGKLFDTSLYTVMMDKYDIALLIRHNIVLSKLNYRKVAEHSSELADKLEKLYYSTSDYHMMVPIEQYRNLIHIRRAEFTGENRWTSLGCNGVFEIEDDKVNILLEESFRKEYLSLGLSRYITINCGFGRAPSGDSVQTKVWPVEHYERFVEMFKTAYPDVEVVQVSGKEAEAVKGVDKCFLGKNFEVIKHVLKNAILHLDGEGGIVHLATQLGTKCVVLFGPTPVHYYGYPRNINIVSETCSNCMGIAADWYTKCYRRGEKRICMKSISPETVFETIREYLEKSDAEV